MVESLPDALQEKVAEHIREFITDMQDDSKWNDSFERTQERLVASAQQAKREIAEGKSTPMNYEQL